MADIKNRYRESTLERRQAQARAARDRAIDEVQAGSAAWVLRARSVIIDVAGRLASFTTDDVWEAMGEDRPDEPRAMGAAIREAVLEGVIEKANQLQQSARSVCHARPLTVWKAV